MTRRRLLDFVPDLYAGLLPAVFEGALAEERHATCDACAMCAPPEPLFAPESYFSPDVKCCTYHPTLPNFAVGGLLGDLRAEGAEGARRMRSKIEARVGVTPLAISPPRKYMLLYGHGRPAFGRAQALACPYLDRQAGRCTVWAHRDAVCGTWFCKYNDGQDGFDFWGQLKQYLLGVQRVLSLHALRELGWDLRALAQADSDAPGSGSHPLDAADMDDKPPSAERYAALWGDWAGREQELYAACHEVVRSLDRAALERLGGIDHELALAQLTHRYRAVREPRIPDPLLKNPSMRVEPLADGSYLITSYVGGDQTRLRKEVYGLLERFDGRTHTVQVRMGIRAHTGLQLSDALLTKLYQHRVLVDPAAKVAP